MGRYKQSGASASQGGKKVPSAALINTSPTPLSNVGTGRNSEIKFDIFGTPTFHFFVSLQELPETCRLEYLQKNERRKSRAIIHSGRFWTHSESREEKGGWGEAQGKIVEQFWKVGKIDTRPISPELCGFVASGYNSAGAECGITAWFSLATAAFDHVTLVKKNF